MQTIIMSIKPQYWNEILNTTKTVEYRKRVWLKTSEPTRVIVYATLPVQMVVGEFQTNNIFQGTPDKIWYKTKNISGIFKNEYFDYFQNTQKANAIEIKSVTEYKPQQKLDSLKKLGVKSAPQSWQYAK